VLAPVALGCAWIGGLPWYGLVALAGVGVAWEWTHMAVQKPGWSFSTLLAGLVYTALSVLGLGWLRSDPASGRPALLFLLALVWSSDVGAYAAGRLIGGPRLAPAISPGKTWSGAAGGLVATLVVGAIAAALWHGPAGPAMLAAAVLGVAAQLGDLLESAVKRHFGVKDSGRLIPGHGGLLDRLDGLMAAALVAMACMWLPSRFGATDWTWSAGWAWLTGQGASTWQ
jgi:phosphatidate cytidylyltransferase